MSNMWNVGSPSAFNQLPIFVIIISKSLWTVRISICLQKIVVQNTTRGNDISCAFGCAKQCASQTNKFHSQDSERVFNASSSATEPIIENSFRNAEMASPWWWKWFHYTHRQRKGIISNKHERHASRSQVCIFFYTRCLFIICINSKPKQLLSPDTWTLV